MSFAFNFSVGPEAGAERGSIPALDTASEQGDETTPEFLQCAEELVIGPAQRAAATAACASPGALEAVHIAPGLTLLKVLASRASLSILQFN